MEENNKLNAKEQIRNSMDSLINSLNYESTTNNVDLNNLEEKEQVKVDDVVRWLAISSNMLRIQYFRQDLLKVNYNSPSILSPRVLTPKFLIFSITA